MIDRAAEAICIAWREDVWDELTEPERDDYRFTARAVIQAMREPTIEMLCRGSDQLGKPKKSLPQCWRDMIDAAVESGR